MKVLKFQFKVFSILDGWEIMGLYEWSRRKTAAVKAKNDAVDSGEREKSPPFSSEDYDSDSSAQGGRKMSFSEPQREGSKKCWLTSFELVVS